MSIYGNMGKLSRNLRICGDCGIVYTSVSLTKYIDQCPLCNSKLLGENILTEIGGK